MILPFNQLLNAVLGGLVTLEIQEFKLRIEGSLLLDSGNFGGQGQQEVPFLTVTNELLIPMHTHTKSKTWKEKATWHDYDKKEDIEKDALELPVDNFFGPW